jgi:murein L,D-transpeptidase YcbB/YkuD
MWRRGVSFAVLGLAWGLCALPPAEAFAEEGRFSPEAIRAAIDRARRTGFESADPLVVSSVRPPAAVATVQGPPQGPATPEQAPPQLEAGGEPVFGPGVYARTLEMHRRYEAIEAQGGWPQTPAEARALKPGATGPLVRGLRERLAISGDLEEGAAGEIFDEALSAAIKRFQRRHGLSQTGRVGPLTLKALNVPVEHRINQLAASAHRLYGNGFEFGRRYVVVNIPGAIAEAVEDGRVVSRHVAIVGRPDRPSPVIEARIRSINLNPVWTAPESIVRRDIADKILADPGFLEANHMRLVDHRGQPVDPAGVDWAAVKSMKALPFLLRQDPGPMNALGAIKIDMPNTLAVYMHDTPKKELFRQDLRFNSSGCARIEGVERLAAWLLAGEGVDEAELQARIAFGDRSVIPMKKAVPVAWVYLTGWGDADGLAQFRDDIYGLDTYEGVARTTIRRKAKPAAAPAPSPGGAN